MSAIDEVYIELAEIYAKALESEKLEGDLGKLVMEGKSKEEAVLTLALGKGFRFYACVREVNELVKVGWLREEAISEVAKGLKISAGAEEEVKMIGKGALRRRLFGEEREEALPEVPPSISMLQRVRGSLLRIFLHGIAFSLLFTALSFVWLVLLIFLMAIGWILGLIIGFGILMLIVGGLNSLLASAIWGIDTNTSFWSVFIHGFALFITLLVANLGLVFLPNMAFPGVATLVATFIISTIVDGYIGRSVAEMFPE